MTADIADIQIGYVKKCEMGRPRTVPVTRYSTANRSSEFDASPMGRGNAESSEYPRDYLGRSPPNGLGGHREK
ncbi:hypothetical protein TPL01_20960 [Sulfuriferula plumbiphila]|uniref:Uncharacterized protein n=1 Tax=Sulfuriferula plumbiphila TaxID=171865 RepID=A0A512L8Z0_9PROT|nr:hypothetical protein SFPGR_18470 [Sulfuriferula plumbiphila]GEP30958.1 hypothetical protein TPL01_20960 [Sulfuriferula plumbiphila]